MSGESERELRLAIGALVEELEGWIDDEMTADRAAEAKAELEPFRRMAEPAA